jgi:phage gp46-like protein
MARDIRITNDNYTQEADFQQNNGDLLIDEGLETAVQMSLFTRRRASLDEVDDVDDRGGWWADQISTFENDEIGSKLWLLSRSKNTPQNVKKAREYAYESLEWLIEDKIVQKIEVEAEGEKNYNGDWLKIKAKLFKSDGNIIAYKYETLWDNL